MSLYLQFFVFIISGLQAKATLWEGGVRCVGLVWSPLINESRRVSNEVITSVQHAGTHLKPMHTFL